MVLIAQSPPIYIYSSQGTSPFLRECRLLPKSRSVPAMTRGAAREGGQRQATVAVLVLVPQYSTHTAMLVPVFCRYGIFSEHRSVGRVGS